MQDIFLQATASSNRRGEQSRLGQFLENPFDVLIGKPQRDAGCQQLVKVQLCLFLCSHVPALNVIVRVLRFHVRSQKKRAVGSPESAVDDLLYGCGLAVQQVLARNHLVIEEQRAQPIDDETEGLARGLIYERLQPGVDLLVGRDASHDIVEARRVELMVHVQIRSGRIFAAVSV